MNAAAELVAACRRRIRLAAENCPHWDYDDDGNGQHACCAELDAAQRALTKAKARAERETLAEEHSK